MVRFSVCTLNVHLMGALAQSAGRPTKLYYRDQERTGQIAKRIEANGADVVGLTEVWDRKLGEEIIRGVNQTYPYSLFAPSAEGIQGLVNYLGLVSQRGAEVVAERAEKLVDFIATHHFRTSSALIGALRVMNPEDWFMRLLTSGFGFPQIWGAGLLCLSKYPLEEGAFIPFRARADLEHFAGKGILEATVRPTPETPIRLLLTHLQEGKSRQARRARANQVGQIAEEKLRSLLPVILMGDLNVLAEKRIFNERAVRHFPTAEYIRTAAALGLRDSFRLVHPDPEEEAGYTYDNNNPFAIRLGEFTPGEVDQLRRIDYVWGSPTLVPGDSRVLSAELLSDTGEFPLTDHWAVQSSFALQAVA